ncbi:MAG: hypothetical protein OEX12_15185 [Gammaproteobacteria bacterium]|nr:hypothetical protein [Gammaproteobacteria bacterium]
MTNINSGKSAEEVNARMKVIHDKYQEELKAVQPARAHLRKTGELPENWKRYTDSRILSLLLRDSDDWNSDQPVRDSIHNKYYIEVTDVIRKEMDRRHAEYWKDK